ncbi:MAG: methionyl-tRNA formyltransferase, partial [Firmicutes bacterium]|nr:methionyl-tRNA formyltransferase [Bacillota bacterium]
QPSRLDKLFLEELKSIAPAIIITVAYGRILPKAVLDLPPLGCINLHASLLPAYRGAAPIHRAVINGEKETGVTVIYMTEELDAGDIILQESIPIKKEDTAGTIHDILAERGASLLLKAIHLLETKTAKPYPQDASQATYAPPLKPEEEKIDWSKPATEIYNLIRGMNPWPVAYTYFQGRRLKVWGASLLDKMTGLAASPGEVISVGEKGIKVSAGVGELLITEVQPAGRCRMSAVSFSHGHVLKKGCRLGENSSVKE